MAKFLVHRHSTGRTHYDLRLIQEDSVRSWSLLKEPVMRNGESRLAIEREELPVEALQQTSIDEEAFGPGRARVWDAGKADIEFLNPGRIVVVFSGAKLAGRYDLKLTRWYPGNRWLLKKLHGNTD